MSETELCQAGICRREGTRRFKCTCGSYLRICDKHATNKQHISQMCRSYPNCAICRIDYRTRRAKGRDTVLIWAPQHTCSYEVCTRCVWQRFRNKLKDMRFEESIRAIGCVAKECAACGKLRGQCQRYLARSAVLSWKLVTMNEQPPKQITICSGCLTRRLIEDITTNTRRLP